VAGDNLQPLFLYPQMLKNFTEKQIQDPI